MSPKTVAVIILNWNSNELTSRCLNSLGKSDYPHIKTFVVDNGSDKESATKLSHDFPYIELIQLHKNHGVAGGRNRGIEEALKQEVAYICFLDNDTIVAPDLISQMLALMEEDPTIGMVAPKIYVLGSPNIIQRAGCPSWKLFYLYTFQPILQFIWEIMGRTRQQNWWDLSRGWGQLDTGQYDCDKEISFSIGACQLIRTEALQKVGLLDERFNPYGSEDIDFCERLSKAGYKIFYSHKAHLWHEEQSSFIDSYDRTYYNQVHIVLLARKHLSRIEALLFWIDFWMLNVPLKVMRYVSQGHINKLRGLKDAVYTIFKT